MPQGRHARKHHPAFAAFYGEGVSEKISLPPDLRALQHCEYFTGKITAIARAYILLL
jgi:hypothetical protein